MKYQYLPQIQLQKLDLNLIDKESSMQFRIREVRKGIFVAEYQKTKLQRWNSCFTREIQYEHKFYDEPVTYMSEKDAQEALDMYCKNNKIEVPAES